VHVVAVRDLDRERIVLSQGLVRMEH
jgi:hypothetical protein